MLLSQLLLLFTVFVFVGVDMINAALVAIFAEFCNQCIFLELLLDATL
jgi:hypothetical protein